MIKGNNKWSALRPLSNSPTEPTTRREVDSMHFPGRTRQRPLLRYAQVYLCPRPLPFSHKPFRTRRCKTLQEKQLQFWQGHRSAVHHKGLRVLDGHKHLQPAKYSPAAQQEILQTTLIPSLISSKKKARPQPRTHSTQHTRTHTVKPTLENSQKARGKRASRNDTNINDGMKISMIRAYRVLGGGGIVVKRYLRK